MASSVSWSIWCPKSVLVNLNFALTLGPPQDGQYDFQSILAHEFGHVLGLAHSLDGTCYNNSDPSSWLVNPCANDGSGSRDTMAAVLAGVGQICQRNLSTYDQNSANEFY